MFSSFLFRYAYVCSDVSAGMEFRTAVEGLFLPSVGFVLLKLRKKVRALKLQPAHTQIQLWI